MGRSNTYSHSENVLFMHLGAGGFVPLDGVSPSDPGSVLGGGPSFFSLWGVSMPFSL
jgi:hypothetical protein